MTAGTQGSLVQLSDGARLYVKILGDNDRSKQLLVVIHGAPGVSDHRESEASFEFLSSRFRVLVYDARGSGRSDPKGPYTHARWAADVDELRIWAGSEPIILAGASYGGHVALEYAINYPKSISAIILQDTSASGPQSTMYGLKSSLTSPRIKVDADRQYRAWTGTLRDNDDLQASLAEIHPILASEKSTGEPLPRTIDPGKLRLRYETYNFAIGYNQPRFDVRPKLADISAPTLILVGRHDLISPVPFSEELYRLMPNSQLTVFQDSGHNPAMEEPEAFQRRLIQFLDNFRL
ncbi:alpha/beta hydrolase fold protein [Metarhizium rileyi]|uniref:Alpha/beta hydrolase fold protein n=1 Tax=Metarhizium rileyi (strain RCEF 4871) TaxID=1649241 RepID=A0A167FAC7_METRR|nr:alpha/beta hydrolase fold protein [Metarhizium rileyi RCEF 4871]TWU74659.1 hypothetical protein ED733_003514 [Metarhizium rileyi]